MHRVCAARCDVAGGVLIRREVLEDAVTAVEHEPPSTLLHALEWARALGCADGRTAFAFEPDEEPAAAGSWCHGLGPEDFARLVWNGGAGTAPAGVRLNAPLWYGLGFREGLASARAAEACGALDHPLAAEPSRLPVRAQTSSRPFGCRPQEDPRAR